MSETITEKEALAVTITLFQGLKKENDRLVGQIVSQIEEIEGLKKENDELEERLKEAVEAALAYQKLSSCYRLGKHPTEKLFKELEKAREFLQKIGGEA